MYDNPKKLWLPVWFVARVSTETYDVQIGKHWALMGWIQKVNVFLTKLSLPGSTDMSDQSALKV